MEKIGANGDVRTDGVGLGGRAAAGKARPRVPTLQGQGPISSPAARAVTDGAEQEPIVGVVRDALDAGREIVRDSVQIGIIQARETVRETVDVARRTVNDTVDTVKRTSREVVEDVGPRIAWGAGAVACGFLGLVCAVVAIFVGAGALIPSVAARLAISAAIFFAAAAFGGMRASHPSRGDRRVRESIPLPRHHAIRPVDGVGR